MSIVTTDNDISSVHWFRQFICNTGILDHTVSRSVAYMIVAGFSTKFAYKCRLSSGVDHPATATITY